MEEKNEPIQVLLYSDSPEATTGLGRLVRYLIRGLSQLDNYHFTVVGVNHSHFELRDGKWFAMYEKAKYPNVDIIAAPHSADYGCQKLFGKALSQKKFDLIITIHDIQWLVPFYDQLLMYKQTHGAKWIMYTSLDRKVLAKEESKVFTVADHLICYTNFFRDKLLKFAPVAAKKSSVVYHPIDVEDFYPLGKEERKLARQEMFGRYAKDNTTVIGNINRNIFRKDPVRALRIFKEYTKNDDNSLLYMHCKLESEDSDLRIPLIELDLKDGQVIFPGINNEVDALPQKQINKLYAAMDVSMSTAMGEGFGYSTVEAMATKTPFIAPNNTAFTELIGPNEERGFLVDCDNYTANYGRGGVIRDTVNDEKYVEKLKYMKAHPEFVEQKAEAAYKWVVENLSIENICKQWQDIITNLMK